MQGLRLHKHGNIEKTHQDIQAPDFSNRIFSLASISCQRLQDSDHFRTSIESVYAYIYILYIYVHYTCQQDRTLQGYRSVVAHNISGPTAYRPLWVKPLFSACDVSFSCSCHQWHESHLRNTSVDFEFKVWSFFDAPSLHFRNMGLTPLLLVAVSTIHLAKT